MYEFHKDNLRYFQMTYDTAKHHIVPFIRKQMDIQKPITVLEIGCAYAGVLKAFTEMGHRCVGIELVEKKLEFAQEYMKEEVKQGLVRFLGKDIYEVDPIAEFGHKFDLIILKDVIEHIPRQEVFIPKLHEFLNPGGKVFFAFPPWYMPFGGHQQVSSSKWLRKMPYFHLLPSSIYKGILRMFGEKEYQIENLMDIKRTGISIERFERIIQKNNFSILECTYYLFNPIYQYKFGIKPRKQSALIAGIPWVRDFFTSAMYYLVG
jgi:2-polyprenyl-3-methyl-5-hydroxy-6-metoxy-1,4-benzoquinol methylase